MTQRLGVIGGSGLYELADRAGAEEVVVDTPYGLPSDALVRTRIGDTEIVFLPRHGRGHRLPPHRINYRANLCALKKLGVHAVLSVSAVGSMREGLAPGDVCVIDQLIDLTKRRVSTFFEDGVAAHVAFSDPICEVLSTAVASAAEHAASQIAPAPSVHRGGTYVCIEGPQFSTRAESRLYRSWGVDVVGMTNMPEAKLAREAELPYATLALVTDYDCWHDTEEAVDVPAVVARLRGLTEIAKGAVTALCERGLPDLSASRARGALDHAVMTAREAIPLATQQQLAWLLRRPAEPAPPTRPAAEGT